MDLEAGVDGTPEVDEPRWDELRLGGLELDLQLGFRFNVFYKSWVTGSSRLAPSFDTVMVGFDARYKNAFASLSYRFYDGTNFLHHGYVGYEFDDRAQIQIGVNRKPFGLLPYASHNWFFSLAYYVGFEDDNDLGAKLIIDRDQWNLQFAYYLREEASYYGDSIDSARYSYDIVETNPGELGYAGVMTTRTNQERNQINLRLAYTFEHGEACSTEIGWSGEWGEIRNGTTRRSGDRWACAGHLNGNYGRFNVQLEAMWFSNRPENPAGQDDRFIVRGAYDAPYKTASNGWIFISNVAYRIPHDGPPFDAITLYADYSYLLKSESSYNDSQQLVVGASIESGPALIYVDFAFGQNQPFIGPDYGTSLAEGGPNGSWELRFNVNVGFYF